LNRDTRLHAEQASILDVNEITNCLKLFLRKLTDPVLTTACFASLVQAAEQAHGLDLERRVFEIVKTLPPAHFFTLAYLVQHLTLCVSFCSLC
jgi:hypothetical protein